MKVSTHKIYQTDFADQWRREIEDHWNYDDFIRDERWRREWISIDGVVCHPANGRVYVGITSFDGDIFKALDVATGQFIDLGFGEVGNKFDAKFHRAMELTRDGDTLYTATALLHDIDRYWEAPGGGIYQHDTATGTTKKLTIPLEHNYIQSIALDEKRGVIYAMHLTPERLSRYDLASGQSEDLGPIGSGFSLGQGENIALDDDGNLWCGWSVTRAWQSSPGPDSARLCKYDPTAGRIHYFNYGLPRADGEYGNAKVEGLFNLGTDCLYASGGNGSLYRIDTRGGNIRYLGTPISDRRSRLTSLALHSDGYAYGITGRDGACRLLRFDPRDDSYELGDDIIDQEGTPMWQCHDIDITPEGILYAGENDHPKRSSYLWEIAL